MLVDPRRPTIISKLPEEAQSAAERQPVPFDIDTAKRKRQARRPGRKDGHQGDLSATPDYIDQRIEFGLGGCPHCAVALDNPEEDFLKEIGGNLTVAHYAYQYLWIAT